MVTGASTIQNLEGMRDSYKLGQKSWFFPTKEVWDIFSPEMLTELKVTSAIDIAVDEDLIVSR